MIQDGAVLGKTFFKQGVARVSAMSEKDLDPILSALLRKEVLSLQADPRSPERGQYGFLQDLVRKVAYDTLSKKERKAKHLAAAAFLEESWTGEEDEIVEVVAAHYLSAYEAAPDAEDAESIRDKARGRLVVAGERAASLAAPAEGLRYLEQALALTDDPRTRAELLERAGALAWQARRSEKAEALYAEAIASFGSLGLTHSAARVTAALAEVDAYSRGQIDEAVKRMEEAFEVLRQEEPDADLATLAAELGRFHYFRGEIEVAADRVDLALGIAEALWLPEVVSQALNTKGLVATARARPQEGIALLSHALEVALSNDRSTAALRAYYNLAELNYGRDRYAESIDLHERALALSRRIGSALWEQLIREGMPYPLFMSGHWDEALERAGEVSTWDWTGETSALLAVLPTICVNRGLQDGLDKLIELSAQYDGSTDMQRAGGRAVALAVMYQSRGEYAEAFSQAEDAISCGLATGADSPIVRIAFASAVDSAFAMGDLEKVESVLGSLGGLRRGEVWPSLLALGERTTARLAVARGQPEDAERGFVRAIALFREMGMPYWLGASLTELAESLARIGRLDDARPLLEEAHEIFERLRAEPWLERVGNMLPARPSVLAPP